MFNWKEFEKSQHIFSTVGDKFYHADNGQHHVHVRPKDLLRWVEMIRDDLGYLTLVDLVGVDRLGLSSKYDERFELVYHFLNMGNHQRLNIHVLFNDNEIVPSLVQSFNHADWMEREQAEMLKIIFDRPQSTLILPQGQQNWPMRKDSKMSAWPTEKILDVPKIQINPNKSEEPWPEESYQWKRFDVFSPETMGNFEWMVCFDPSKVVDSHLRIGLHHEGFEKLLESRSWIQVLQLVDKIHLGAAPTYATAWARTIEETYRIKVPERAQAIRIVMLELARVAEHLTVLSDIALASKQNEFRLFLNAREKVYELFEKFCGHRQGLNQINIGGMREDLPYGWITEYQSVNDIIFKNLRTIHKSLIGQKNFRSQLEGGDVDAQQVLQWGVSGPAMRAAGLNFDLRKSQPFYFYQDIDFDIPVGIYGTAYDRYLIRLEEIFQSLRIVTQVIDNLPLGEIISAGIQEAMLDETAFSSDRDWQFISLESPNGEAGFFHLAGADFSPYRIKIKTPSFALAQAAPYFMKGLTQDQLPAGMASLGIRRQELDR